MASPSVLGRVDVGDLVRFRDRVRLWAADQLPFATAAALTDTAKDAAAELRRSLPDAFQVRNRTLGNAVAHQPAEKLARPIEARVGLRPWAEFLVLQVTGGTKRGRAGSRVSVPTRLVQGRRTASGRVPKALRPRALRERKTLVPGLLEERGLIALRVRRRVLVHYTLVQSARIRARWPFVEVVRRTARARLSEHFLRRSEQALSTRR